MLTVIDANGVKLCTESFGAAGDPPILLIAGAGDSMLWWDATFCFRLADAGRFVIRYDQRDTGRSSTLPPGYTRAELVADAVGVLDAYQLTAANIVGVAAGGVIAQLVALGHADRVSSLTLISTTAAVPGGRPLPPPAPAFERFVAASKGIVDWTDRESVIRHRVARCRALAGHHPFHEFAIEDLVRLDVERSHDFMAARHHDLIATDDRVYPPLSSITVPTLIVHGLQDPMFPPDHGVALAEEIPEGGLLPLADAGSGLDQADWDQVLTAIQTYTSPAGLPVDPRMQQW